MGSTIISRCKYKVFVFNQSEHNEIYLLIKHNLLSMSKNIVATSPKTQDTHYN